MPLGLDHMATVGFVMGGGARDGKWVDGKPIGTAFRVTVNGDRMKHAYVVTAAHVLWDQDAPFVRWRVPMGGGAVIDQDAPREWYQHWDADVALAPIEEKHHLPQYAISLETQTMRRDLDAYPQFGANVYYLGLFDPVVPMAESTIPMVRSGTVGALWQPIQPDPSKPPFDAHLIDCRSYGGFSGSPCLVQLPFPGPRDNPHAPPFPEYLFAQARTEGFDTSRLGIMMYATLLFGMLIQHIDDRTQPEASKVGVGVVLPVERIMDVVMSEELVEQRKKKEADAPKGPEYAVENLSAGSAYGEADFKRDLKRVTKKLDKPRQEGS